MRYWVWPFLWMAIIFYSSSQPYQDQDIKPMLSDYINLSFLNPFLAPVHFTYHHSEVSLEALGAAGLVEFFIRKGAHVTVFLILTLLFYYSLRKSTSLTNKMVIITAWILTVVYAAFDEWHQGMTPNRTPYFGDVLLDTTGATIAVGILFIVSSLRKSGK
ncbi:VanZ family protein [Thalassobacillus devorans]|uniref:VanZ family protein n=1 Tax=Thalassobacillus devorans TaxID=279813 RepID=A0ABQ1NXT5_9BACI|nr:VanZ family protein [Thalassobacillus devorans]NIK28522.1 VanZ family protein [Thalassobacillus devorans]GGC85556.1 VanZ family protein [Thalassobacillus devorans]